MCVSEVCLPNTIAASNQEIGAQEEGWHTLAALG